MCFAFVVKTYCQTSGQLINLQESIIIFNPKMKVQVKRAIWDMLGISEQIGTLMYLEVLIMGWRLRRVDCKPMEQQIQDRLEGWLPDFLSMIDRTIPVRSIMSSIPIYLLVNMAISYF